MHRPLRLILLVSACLCVAALVACPKPVEQNEPGPGGLPRGIVEGGVESADEADWPLYEGAERRAAGVYATRDPIDVVTEYYTELLGIDPEVSGELNEVRTFVTEDFQLVLIGLGRSGETEIRFSELEEGS